MINPKIRQQGNNTSWLSPPTKRSVLNILPSSLSSLSLLGNSSRSFPKASPLLRREKGRTERRPKTLNPVAMGLRGFFFVLVLVISCTYSESRGLVTYDTIDLPKDYKVPISESKVPVTVERNEQLCTLCEEFTTEATTYLGNNKTETEIMDTLHQACSRLHSFELQCVMLVDYYAPLFFIEIATIRPEEFCTKVNLCEKTSVALPNKEETCTLCHQVVVQILAKLKDPDAQLEIIQRLVKECNKMEHYTKECKQLVFRYGPLILANGEKFLETTDVCTAIHACSANQNVIGSATQAIQAESLSVDA